jgi:membrane-bound ClpP family serine protease
MVGLCAVASVDLASAQEDSPVVHLVPIEGVIDLGLAPFIERSLDEAH